MYRGEEELQQRKIFEYDENYNPLRQTEYDSEGNMEWQRIFRYNDQGNMIDYDEYDGEGNLIRSHQEG